MSLSLGSKNETPTAAQTHGVGVAPGQAHHSFSTSQVPKGHPRRPQAKGLATRDQSVGQTSSHTPGWRIFYSYLCPDTNQKHGHHGEKAPGSSGPCASHPRASGWSPGQAGSGQSHGDSGWATSKGVRCRIPICGATCDPAPDSWYHEPQASRAKSSDGMF